jgi:formylglycine-generating enzyme required for sulfatase activity
MKTASNSLLSRKQRLEVLAVVLALASSCSYLWASPDMARIPTSSYSRPIAQGLSQDVVVHSFSISRTEVTISEWAAFLSATNGNSLDWKTRTLKSLDNNKVLALDVLWPTWNISWVEAILYCNWLSKIEGLEPCYIVEQPKGDNVHVIWEKKASGYRLPTLAEWEVAAEVFTSSISGDQMLDYGWFAENSISRLPHEVGQKKPNTYGLFDVRGNMDEYCWDYYNSQPIAASKLIDPDGPGTYTPDPDEVYFKTKLHEVRTFAGGNFGTYVMAAYKNPIGFCTAIAKGFVGIRLCRNAP